MLLLASEGKGYGRIEVLLLCAAVGGLAYGLYRVLSIGRRGRRFPPGRF